MHRGKPAAATARNLPAVNRRRKVWRISPAAPLGEFVDPSLDAAAQAAPEAGDEIEPPVIHRGWQISSFELLNGVEVSEEDPSTVPAELFDELFKPPKT